MTGSPLPGFLALRRSPLFLSAVGVFAALAIAQVALPARQNSDLENRPLAMFSPPTIAGIASGHWMRDMETAVADQFPARDRWVAADALRDTALLRTERAGVLFGADGWLFEPCAQLNERAVLDNARALESLTQQIGLPAWFMLVPLSSAVYNEALPIGYAPADQQALIDASYRQAPSATPVQILPAMLGASATTTPFYYRLDHHWTAAGAQLAYRELLTALDQRPIDAALEKVESAGFYGTYFARAPSPLLRADTFTLELPAGIALAVNGQQKPSLVDPAQLENRDQYAALLYGNAARITLTGGTGGVLLVIKDSYANAVLPLLAQHYQRIEAVDPRYFTGDLAALAQEIHAEEVLCLYGLSTFSTDRSLVLRAVR